MYACLLHQKRGVKHQLSTGKLNTEEETFLHAMPLPYDQAFTSTKGLSSNQQRAINLSTHPVHVYHLLIALYVNFSSASTALSPSATDPHCNPKTSSMAVTNPYLYSINNCR